MARSPEIRRLTAACAESACCWLRRAIDVPVEVLMNRRLALTMGFGVLALAALEIGPRAIGVSAGSASAAPPSGGGALMWSADLFDNGTQCWHVANAASWIGPAENGVIYDDWRLPTISELQAALQANPPSFGDTSWPNVLGSSIWSASGSGGCGSGSWAYCTALYTDANGNPIPPSGQTKVKVFKNGILKAKYVRP